MASWLQWPAGRRILAWAVQLGAACILELGCGGVEAAMCVSMCRLQVGGSSCLSFCSGSSCQASGMELVNSLALGLVHRLGVSLLGWRYHVHMMHCVCVCVCVLSC